MGKLRNPSASTKSNSGQPLGFCPLWPRWVCHSERRMTSRIMQSASSTPDPSNTRQHSPLLKEWECYGLLKTTIETIELKPSSTTDEIDANTNTSALPEEEKNKRHATYRGTNLRRTAEQPAHQTLCNPEFSNQCQYFQKRRVNKTVSASKQTTSQNNLFPADLPYVIC